MIDPLNIVREYADEELEELFTFCVCVAGKKASIIAPRVDAIRRFAENHDPFQSMFNLFYELYHDLPNFLKNHGIGCSTQKARTLDNAACMLHCADLLRSASVEQLETIWGVGPKTSRFFKMCHDRNARYAALDTHILKWLGTQGIEVPKSTPRGKKYLELEQKFLELVPANKTPAEFDLEIWRSYAT